MGDNVKCKGVPIYLKTNIQEVKTLFLHCYKTYSYAAVTLLYITLVTIKKNTHLNDNIKLGKLSFSSQLQIGGIADNSSIIFINSKENLCCDSLIRTVSLRRF